MKQGYIKSNKKKPEDRTESDFHWLHIRKYSRLGTVFEVMLLRYDFGERYLNLRVIWGTFIALVFNRIMLWCFSPFPDVPPDSPMVGIFGIGSFFFDYFIGLFLLMALYHFIQQWRRRRKGTSIYSHSMGESRLFFIARALRIRNYRYVCYVFIEPLCIFLMIPLVLSYSIYLALMTLLASFWLFWDSTRHMTYHYQQELDRQDSEIFSREALANMKSPDNAKVKLPVLKQQKRPTKPKPLPKLNGKSATPSVKEALQNLSPKLKNLGKQGSENTIS